MLTCDEAAHLMAREIDHALDEQGRRELAGHLAACAACRDEADAQRDVAELLRGRPALEPSPGFVAAVAARLDGEVNWFDLLEWRTWTWRLLPVAAGLFACAVFIGGSASQSSGSASTPSAATAPSAASFGLPLATTDASTGASAPSVFWDAGATSDQILLTVLTGSTSASGKDERR